MIDLKWGGETGQKLKLNLKSIVPETEEPIKSMLPISMNARVWNSQI